jgi:hypothetical protein
VRDADPSRPLGEEATIEGKEGTPKVGHDAGLEVLEAACWLAGGVLALGVVAMVEQLIPTDMRGAWGLLNANHEERRCDARRNRLQQVADASRTFRMYTPPMVTA